MSWEKQTVWLWKSERITEREYPAQSSTSIAGRLLGHAGPDYFHFQCPECKANQLDVELIGARDDTSAEFPKAKAIILGLHCPQCGLTDLIKIGCLYRPEGQVRRLSESP